MKTRKFIKKSFSKNTALFLGIGFFLLLVLSASAYLFNNGEALDPQKSTVKIERQSFRLEVVERGIVRPAKITAIKSEISGNEGKLIWILPEGELVNKGLIVARFDTKPLMEELQKVEQQLADGQAQLEVAIKELELNKEAGKAKVEAAQRRLELADIKANDSRNGSGLLARKKLDQIVSKSLRNRDLKRKEFEDIQPLLEKGHITQRESEKAEHELLSAQETLLVDRAALTNFDKYEWPKIIREADVVKEAAKMELDRVNRTNELEQQQYASKVEKFRRDIIVKEKELIKAEKELAACDVYSPTSGILLYSLLALEGKKRKIEIGDSIWIGQTFLEIPDTTDLIVEINIREIDVTKLALDMDAEIILDAHPQKIFYGKLITVAALAQKDEENSSVRRFFAKIRLTDITPAIHVGMSASVNIIYKRLENVIAAPVSSIMYENGKPVIRRVTDDSSQLVEVEIGAMGVKWAEILGGFSEGEQIVPNPI